MKSRVMCEALPSLYNPGRHLQVGVHERFLRDELDVVVATVAFGMGAPAFFHGVGVGVLAQLSLYTMCLPVHRHRKAYNL